jgi:hypothetical protein
VSISHCIAEASAIAAKIAASAAAAPTAAWEKPPREKDGAPESA